MTSHRNAARDDPHQGPASDPSDSPTDFSMSLGIWIAGCSRFEREWTARLSAKMGQAPDLQREAIELKGMEAMGWSWALDNRIQALEVFDFLVSQTNQSPDEHPLPVGLMAMMAWRHTPIPGEANHIPLVVGWGSKGKHSASLGHYEARSLTQQAHAQGHPHAQLAQAMAEAGMKSAWFDQPWKEAVAAQSLDERLATSELRGRRGPGRL